MDCLVDFVGLFDGCGGQTPQSGMWLNQLPGIEFSNIDGIANSDQINWVGLWSDLQQTAKETFREDVIEEFGKSYMLKQITQTVDLGKVINTTNLTAPPTANVSNGLLFETMYQGGQCIGSNLEAVYIQEIKFYWQGTNPTPAFTLTFQDADLLNVEMTIVATNVVPGWNVVWVDKLFTAKRLQVLATGNFDNYVQLDLSLFNLDNFGGYTWGFGGNYAYLYYSYGTCGIQTRINGITYNNATNIGISNINCFGMSAVMSTKCTWDAIVCANKRQFASAWQHLLAIELLNYRLNTSRLNRWASVDKKQGADLQKLLTVKYRGGVDGNGTQYAGKLQSAIKSIVLNDNDGCIRNNAYIKWMEKTP
jgi:hypothetical protein